MKTDKNLIILVVAALLITVVGAGAFLAEAPDNIYTYNGVHPANVSYGTPIQYAVQLSENNRVLLDCDKNGMGNRVSPDTLHYCQSFTYFNARSIDVTIDGNYVSNYYFYPANATAFGGVSLSTTLPNVGAVCCWQVQQACSVCSDQNNAGTQSQRAFLFGIHKAPQTSLDGSQLFLLTIPQTLSNGVHTVQVAYFAETVKGANDNTYTPEMHIALGGWGYGENNNRVNHVDTFIVNVSGGYVAPPPPVNNTTVTCNNNGVCSVGETILNCPADCAVLPPPANNSTTPPPTNTTCPIQMPACSNGYTYTNGCVSGCVPMNTANNNIIVAIGIIAGAIFVWKVMLKK